MARSWPTPAQATRRRQRSPKIWAVVVIGLTVTVLGILGWTLSSVEGITRGFYDNQLGADAVANAHRELLRLQTEVEHLHGADDTAAVEMRRGLLRQQLRILPGILGSARTRQVQIIDEGIRGIDWSQIEHLPPPGPQRDQILDALNQQLRTIEVEYKEFNDLQVRRFYEAAGNALSAKTDAQRLLGVLVILTVTVAGAWALAARRRARSDLSEAYDSLWVSEVRMAALVESSTEAIVGFDPNLVVTVWNGGAAQLYGYSVEEAIGRPVTDFRPDGTTGESFLNDVARHGARITSREVRVRRKDGGLALVSLSASPMFDRTGQIIGITSIGHDISERQRLESELRHAQKLESVGQLAAGIAHEINTPIQFVGDNVRFLKDAFGDFSRLMDAYHQAETSPEPGAALAHARELAVEMETAFLVAEVPEAIDQTLDGVQRVATIVRAMKAFAHPSGEQKALADLNEAVRNTLVVANNELKCVADVVTDLGDLPMVACHLGDINQVLLNLVVNAAQAVAASVDGSGERGTITVRTRHDGDAVVIEVADTGVGIPDGIVERVFEPFFTTKDVGKGTGQGLALAYTLVTDRHGGTITFRTQPGAGTTFTVRLPLATNRQEPMEHVA